MRLLRHTGLLTLMVVTTGVTTLVGRTPRQPTCPTPALVPLFSTRGDWVVTWRDRLAPDHYVTTQARSTIELSAGGCGLLEHFEGGRHGHPFTAVSLIGPASPDSLQRIWQDSEHGTLLLFQAFAQARPLRFEWSRDLGDRVLRLRYTYLALGPDRFTTETELSTDGGESWQIVAHLEYRRRGA
jgi:hypothetical protein